jgi:hypothetical protein
VVYESAAEGSELAEHVQDHEESGEEAGGGEEGACYLKTCWMGWYIILRRNQIAGGDE